MSAIQMVDLKTQYHKIKADVDKAVLDVLDSTAFINGKPVGEFSTALASYLNVEHVIPCANGTDALQIAMMALGLQPGDEVITPSFTYVATTEVVALLRLTPVFVDVEPDTFCMDAAKIEAAITPRTKAIVPVHLYGHAVNMEPILALAEKHGLYVIEDTAQALGGSYSFANGQQKKVGTMGHVGCTSFFPSKNLGCYGDGGAMFTNDAVLADRLRMIANHGQKVRYYHDMVGCNSRLDTVQAAILNIKLPLLDGYNAARRQAAQRYNELFAHHPKITTPFEAAYSHHVFHQYTLKLENANRDELVQHLAAKGIPSMIYYPVPVHRQRMFADFGGADFELPVTDWLTERVISLPMHSELTEAQQQLIAAAVLEFLQ
ncbi:MAG: DegT/DnrJ/EryC1/StrS family aminotransferase [Chitinophagaceae bacterium]|nr:DegT/DnrJ/EryC1/StrS family aminotransferase [Chitinophagaceae bacterium]